MGYLISNIQKRAGFYVNEEMLSNSVNDEAEIDIAIGIPPDWQHSLKFRPSEAKPLAGLYFALILTKQNLSPESDIQYPVLTVLDSPMFAYVTRYGLHIFFS